MKKFILIIFIFLVTPILIHSNTTPIYSAELSTDKILFTYLYGGKSSDYINQLSITNDSINIVSPNYFNLDSDGNLLTSINQSFIDFVHSNNMKIMPFLSNHWNQNIGQVALNKRDQLSKDIIKAIIDYNLDGVNIDLENITYTDRDSLNQFIELLSQGLKPYGKTVSVAVGAITGPVSSGWQAAYDLKTLGNHADFIILMAYDEHWSGGKPGPIASVPWVNKVLKYTTTQVAKEKILLGVPFYGRHWVNNKGASLHYKDVITRVENYKEEISFSEELGVPFSIFTDGENKQHEIWFEDAKSLLYKMRLLHQYGIKGAAAWRLGQEDPSIWENFRTWLDGNTEEPSRGSSTNFLDLTNHWAKDAIYALYDLGYVQGYSTTKFGPERLISRAETVVIINRILKKEPTEKTPFQDISKTFWAFKDISALSEVGIIKGITSTNFSPEGKLTRAQMAAILVRAFNIQSTDNVSTFIDVREGYWAYKDISALRSKGFVFGRENNKFYPDEPITRAEMVVMIERLLKGS